MSRERFTELYSTYIKRPGAEELFNWIENTDFLTAPASTKYHEPYEGGLCEHSVHVFDELVRLLKAYPEIKVSGETAAIVSLLHDICKVGCYKTELRNKKNEFGQWVQVPFYTFQEDTCFGSHGAKSVFIIQKFMKLTDEEIAAINCHMGVENGNYAVNDAFRQFPLAFLLHTADMASTIPKLSEEA
ncbi:MAG: hydrolase [Ruminococcaceae bacterium]|nr:hydrolase [Oscillospiraceae bacterium]